MCKWVFMKSERNESYCSTVAWRRQASEGCKNGRQAWDGEWGPERWGWGLDWVRVEGEWERVHWSELGHQGRVREEDEKERERGNEKRRELFTAAVTASCYCLPGGRIEDLRPFCAFFVRACVCVRPLNCAWANQGACKFACACMCNALCVCT